MASANTRFNGFLSVSLSCELRNSTGEILSQPDLISCQATGITLAHVGKKAKIQGFGQKGKPLVFLWKRNST